MSPTLRYGKKNTRKIRARTSYVHARGKKKTGAWARRAWRCQPQCFCTVRAGRPDNRSTTPATRFWVRIYSALVRVRGDQAKEERYHTTTSTRVLVHRLIIGLQTVSFRYTRGRLSLLSLSLSLNLTIRFI